MYVADTNSACKIDWVGVCKQECTEMGKYAVFIKFKNVHRIQLYISMYVCMYVYKKVCQ